jgi:hypothetical protein
MEKAYFLRRKKASLKLAREATSSEARLAQFDLAGRYDLQAASAKTTAIGLVNSPRPEIRGAEAIDDKPAPEAGAWLRRSQEKAPAIGVQAALEVREENSAAAAKTEWIKRGFWMAVALVLGGVAATVVT